MGFLWRVVISGVALWVATVVLSGMQIVGAENTVEKVGVVLAVAVIFGLVNAVVKPIVALLSAPFYLITLGLFHLVVNALMLMLTAWITDHGSWGLRVNSFWTALVGAIIVSVVSAILSALTGDVRAKNRR
ncbi:phage holin family protein [Williamsia sterculiae]|uniref:phage holin family protein n=1 Tax=Williamsia sterculiae TaxID=1344003 RepID=UPI0009704B6D|nr:phage holin family protein [Williamsia sterculiae]